MRHKEWPNRAKFPVVDMEATGQAIVRCRKQRGLTISQMARKLGVSYTAIYKWENGLTIPSVDSLINLSFLFGTPIDTLLVRKKRPAVV